VCGIVGMLSFQANVTEWHTEIANSLDLIARRGPDDQGIWSDWHSCILGFRRLSILDLSPAGHQPMLSQDGRYVIVFNGEVYNFRELRRKLELRGVKFRSTGDTEVVLYALAHWGVKALNHLNGMFALGFYDTVENRLLLARDHAGIKPLYYMMTPKGLVFASQYDQILAHSWSRGLEVCREALAMYLDLSYIPAPYALLQNTHMLEPGSWLEVNTDGNTSRGRFFEFPVYREPDLRGEEAYEAVDAAVTKAVRRHMVSDVPLGTFLSGGIDSPLVAAKMRSVSNGNIPAFTLGTNGDRFDESPDAIVYARELGLDHVVWHVTPDDALGMLDDVIDACGEPFADYSIFPTMLISRLARQKVKVMLSGDGGDEIFWGYVDRIASVLYKAHDFRHPYWWRIALWGAKKIFRLGKGYPGPRWRSIGDWYLYRHTYNGHRLRHIFPDLPQWPAGFKLFDYTGWELEQTAQWLRWNEFTGLLTRILLKVDRASMYHSLEVRVPLLDRDVLEVSSRINWSSCLDMERKIGKLPLRHALAHHVHFQTQKKRGFMVPMGAWLRGVLRPVFEEAVLRRSEIMGLPVRRDFLQKMFLQHLSEKVDFSWGLWRLLSLSLWEERHYRYHT